MIGTSRIVIFKDEFLFCKTLQTMTKADDVLRLVANFFQKQQIKWEKLSSVCTDGAPAMIGKRTGFTTLLTFLFLFMVLCLFIAHSEYYANKSMKKYNKILKLLQSEKFNS